MGLIEQIAAERRERTQAVNEALRREVDPNRYRTDADRARLAATDAERISAEQELNAARRESYAAQKAVTQLSQKDGGSLFFRDLSPGRMTPAAAGFVARGKAAQEAIDAARERLQTAIRTHNAALREIDAAGAARRRAAQSKAGQFGKKAV